MQGPHSHMKEEWRTGCNMLHHGWNLRHCTKWNKPIAKRQILWFHLYTGKILMLGKIEGKMRRGQQRTRRLDSITDSMNMNFSKLRGIVEERRAWHAIVCGVTNSQTWLSNWVTTKLYKVFTVVKITETESRMVVPMEKEKRGVESHCLMIIEAQFYKMKRVLLKNDCDRNMLLMFLMPLNCLLENG